MKIIKHKKWYKYLNKELENIEKQTKGRLLTENEIIKYDEIQNCLEYIYKENGYT